MILPIGKLESDLLDKIVFKRIKYKRPEVIQRPGIGEDCAVVDFGEYECIMSTDPITGSAEDIGKLAINVTLNDIASNGIEPLGIMLAVMLPYGTTVQDVEKIMKQAGEEAEKHHIEIIGGHTETPKADGYLTTGMPPHSYVNIYWNGPEGISDARKSVLRADAGCSFAVADFNGDGWLDVFVGSYHGGKDRDTNSFLYWNREGKFRELDRQLLYTHSASGCVAADFNEDGYIDLAVANHKVDGDHKGYSTVWWNGEKGFNPERCTNLPTNGPHGMTAINPGNILTRSDSEFYYSESFPVDGDCTVKSASVEADIPEKTAVLLTVSVNGGEWTKPEGTALKKGDSFQYRLEIVAKNCLRTPRITKVCVDFAE